MFIWYAGLAVGLMVFEKFIQYVGLAVGLKPSAMRGEARLRGLERSNCSKTITTGLTWGHPQARERGRPARVASPRARCPRSQPMFMFAARAARAAPRRDDHRFLLGGRSPPKPSRGRGRGETGFPHPPA